MGLYYYLNFEINIIMQAFVNKQLVTNSILPVEDRPSKLPNKITLKISSISLEEDEKEELLVSF